MTLDEKRKQVIASIAILGGIAGIFVLIILARRLPGVAGEVFGKIAGVVTTPFLMEASVLILGFIVVMLLNYWRQARDGDECVYLEEIQAAPGEPPVASRHWAVYRTKPEEAEGPSEAVLLEGALAIGDHPAAVEMLAAMSDEERRRPEIMRLRIELAKATGKDELAGRLEAELES